MLEYIKSSHSMSMKQEVQLMNVPTHITIHYHTIVRLVVVGPPWHLLLKTSMTLIGNKDNIGNKGSVFTGLWYISLTSQHFNMVLHRWKGKNEKWVASWRVHTSHPPLTPTNFRFFFVAPFPGFWGEPSFFIIDFRPTEWGIGWREGRSRETNLLKMWFIEQFIWVDTKKNIDVG